MIDDEGAPALLCVEDEPMIQMMLVEDLEAAGYQVVAADTGQEALAILASDHAKFQGLISDIDLGSGPDGWMVARTARELRGDLAIVYVSAAGEHGWASQGVPGSLMITKPFASAQLITAISSLLVKPS